MPSLVIFDDSATPRTLRTYLSPLTDLRPCFDVRTGVLTTRERIEKTLKTNAAAIWVPERLLEITQERETIPVNRLPSSDDILLINGRWMLTATPKLKQGETLMSHEGEVLAARMSRADAEAFLREGAARNDSELLDGRTFDSALVLRRPWDVIRFRDEMIAFDLKGIRLVDAAVLGDEASIIGDHPIEAHRTASIGPQVVLDGTLGPVVIDQRATIRPGAILCGPCYVGHDSIVVDRAHIKPNTVIGPVCKVGGEVGGTIFQGYSNKSHEGHLGDSWVGEWVNFGAGTTNSNLLNTYSEITMRAVPDSPREKTGLHFLGCIVGDHVKFAILTRIMTGTVIGTGAMIARSAPPPATVSPFAWMTDDGEHKYRMTRFLEVAETMMKRRRIEMTEHYAQAIRALA